MQNLNSRNNYIVNKFYDNKKILNWLEAYSSHNPNFNGWGSSTTSINNIFDSSAILPQLTASSNNTFTIYFKQTTVVQDAWLAKQDDPNSTIIQLNSPSGMWPYDANNSITFTNVSIPFGSYAIKFKIGGKTYTLPSILQTQILINSISLTESYSGQPFSFTVQFSAPTINISQATVQNLIGDEIYSLSFTKSQILTSSTFTTASPVNTGSYIFSIKDVQENVTTKTDWIIYATPNVTSITNATFETSVNKTLGFTLATTNEYIKSLRLWDGSSYFNLETSPFVITTALFSKSYSTVFNPNTYQLVITFKNDRTYTGGVVLIKNFQLDNLNPTTGKNIGESINFNFFINPTANLADLYFISNITGLKKQVPYLPIPSTPSHNIIYTLNNDLTNDGVNEWRIVVQSTLTTLQPSNIYRFGFTMLSCSPLSLERVNPSVTFTCVLNTDISLARDINSAWLQNIDTYDIYSLTPLSYNSANKTITFSAINGNTLPVGNYTLSIKDRANYTQSVVPTALINVVEQYLSITGLTIYTTSNELFGDYVLPIDYNLKAYFTVSPSIIIQSVSLVNIDNSQIIALTNFTTTSTNNSLSDLTTTTYGRYKFRITTSTNVILDYSQTIYVTYRVLAPDQLTLPNNVNYSYVDIKMKSGIVASELNSAITLSYNNTTINASPSIPSLGIVRLTFSNPLTPLINTNSIISITYFKDSFGKDIKDLSLGSITFTEPVTTLPIIFNTIGGYTTSEPGTTMTAYQVYLGSTNLIANGMNFTTSEIATYFNSASETRVISIYRMKQLTNMKTNVVCGFYTPQYQRVYDPLNAYYKRNSYTNSIYGEVQNEKTGILYGIYHYSLHDAPDPTSLTSPMTSTLNAATANNCEWLIEPISFAIFKKPNSGSYTYTNLTINATETSLGINQNCIWEYRNAQCFARGINLTLSSVNYSGDVFFQNGLAFHPNGNVSMTFAHTSTLQNNQGGDYIILPIIYNTRAAVYPIKTGYRFDTTNRTTNTNNYTIGGVTNTTGLTNLTSILATQNTNPTYKNIGFNSSTSSTTIFYFNILNTAANNINAGTASVNEVQRQYRILNNSTNLITGGSINFTWGIRITNETITQLTGVFKTFSKYNDIYVGFTDNLTTDMTQTTAYLSNFIGINRNGGVIYKTQVGTPGTTTKYNTNSSVTKDSIMPLTAWVPGDCLFFKVNTSRGLLHINVKTENMMYWLPLAPYGINNSKKYMFPELPLTYGNDTANMTSLYTAMVCAEYPDNTITHTTTLERYVNITTAPYSETDPLLFDRDTSTLVI